MIDYFNLSTGNLRELMNYVFLLYQEENMYIRFECEKTEEGLLFCRINNQSEKKNKVAFSSLGGINIIQSYWQRCKERQNISGSFTFKGVRETSKEDLKLFAIKRE